VEFWASLYIPIIVAMAATQNVAGAIRGGPVVLAAASVTVLLCWGMMAVIGRLGRASAAPDAHAVHVLAGDPE
jgi:malonate transporter MadL subunit